MGGELIDELEPSLPGLRGLGVHVTQQVPGVLMRHGLESTEIQQRAVVKTKSRPNGNFEKARSTNVIGRQCVISKSHTRKTTLQNQLREHKIQPLHYPPMKIQITPPLLPWVITAPTDLRTHSCYLRGEQGDGEKV